MKRMALGMMCASALACGGPVVADDQEPAKLFESLDKNSDGTLGPDEVSEDRKRFYERLVRVGDKNEDKKLSREEFVAAMSAEEKPVDAPRTGPGRGDRPMFSPGQMFDRMDRDKDGKFAKTEIPEQAPAELRERLELVFTASGKSEITKEEFEKVMEKYGPPRGPQGRRPDGPRPEGDDEDRPRPPRDGERPRPEGDRREMAREGDRGPGPGREGDRPRPEGDRREMAREGDRPEGRGFGGAPFGGRPMSPLIRMLDRDENGKLNRRELARLTERFDELDRNEDGELDAQEILGAPFGGGGPPFGSRPGFGPDRGREMAREGDRRPEGPRDGDRPRPEGARDGDRPRPEGARDGDRPRPEGARDGDRPRPEGRPGGDRAEGRPGDRPEGRPGFGPPGGGPGRDGGRPGDFFARLDKDGDGSLSKEEAPERMKERFKDLDANSDGKITTEEFREAIAKEFGVPGERRERRPEQEN
jgi:Ca2+-binding EF-hand superfamily protein